LKTLSATNPMGSWDIHHQGNRSSELVIMFTQGSARFLENTKND